MDTLWSERSVLLAQTLIVFARIEKRHSFERFVYSIACATLGTSGLSNFFFGQGCSKPSLCTALEAAIVQLHPSRTCSTHLNSHQQLMTFSLLMSTECYSVSSNSPSWRLYVWPGRTWTERTCQMRPGAGFLLVSLSWDRYILRAITKCTVTSLPLWSIDGYTY